jgi:hypothetical protein
VSRSSYPGASEGTRAALIEINHGINAFRSARDDATAGRGEGPSRRSPPIDEVAVGRV